ncbi:Carbonic AnHydrase [Chamberlinius hualienensis]
MKLLIGAFIIVIIWHITYASSKDCRPWWRYFGERGQDHWCCKGAHICCGFQQSPINIDISVAEYDRDAVCLTLENYNLLPRAMALHNNGHTVELIYNAFNRSVIPMVSNGPIANHTRYALDRVHFHWGNISTYGSEHTLNYLQLPMEMQLIHRNIKYNSLAEARNKSDGLAIISILLKLNRDDNDNLRGVVYNLRDVRWNGQYRCIKPFPILNLLPPSFGYYYSYNGSLTAPPCFESVQWIVFHNPVCISEYQLNEFRKLQEDTEERCPDGFCNLVNNFRKAMCVKNRIVKWKEECPPPPKCSFPPPLFRK